MCFSYKKLVLKSLSRGRTDSFTKQRTNMTKITKEKLRREFAKLVKRHKRAEASKQKTKKTRVIYE